MTKQELINEFDANTTLTEDPDGRVEIKCNKGLWATSGMDADRVVNEAMHYFQQYHRDGEYL